MTKRINVAVIILAVLALLASPVLGAKRGSDAESPAVAWQQIGATGLAWDPVQQFESVTLVVTDSEGLVFEGQYPAGTPIFFDLVDKDGYALPDGTYNFELRGQPFVPASVRAEMEAARASGETVSPKNWGLPKGGFVQSGVFTVAGGSVVDPDLPEPSGFKGSPSSRDAVTAKDQVILDDLIVDGSLCVGFDCVNGESFGFDTIRMKENNTRLKCLDTSSTASFPSNDWQLTCNDSSNGGANKFSIDDISGGRTPFTIEAGAPSHSLYVDDGGRIGFGTSTPVVELHVVDGDTPTLRLEQDGSSGFTPQTWDLAGNETNFFIRDVTNGSALPFRSRPGAPTSSIDIQADGDIGIGTSSPTAVNQVDPSVVIRRTNGEAGLLIQEASGTTATRTLFEMSNNGDSRLSFHDSNTGEQWLLIGQGANDRFVMTNANSGALDLILDAGGNLTINGMLTELSDRDMKESFFEVDPMETLEKVVALPVTTWTYKHLPDSGRHIGPTAQDFKSFFGFGTDDRHVGIKDLAGVSLSAIQGLYKVVQDKDAKISELEARLAALEALIKKK